MSSCLSHNRIRKRALEWGTEKVKCGLLNSYWQRPDSPNTLARELQMFWLCSDTTFSTRGSQHRHHSHAFHLSPCKHQQARHSAWHRVWDVFYFLTSVLTIASALIPSVVHLFNRGQGWLMSSVLCQVEKTRKKCTTGNIMSILWLHYK